MANNDTVLTCTPKLQVIPRSTLDLDVLLRGYELCARTDGKSQHTIRLSKTAINVLLGFLRNNDRPIDADRITRTEIRLFTLYLQQAHPYDHHAYNRSKDRPMTGHTVNAYLRSIRAFWTWLNDEMIVQSNPFTRLKIPKPPRKVIPTFTDQQIKHLLSVIDTATDVGRRDYCMVLVMLDTGIRVSELTGLGTGDVMLDDGLIKVYGKGAKERIVPIGIQVKGSLWAYLRHHRTPPASPQINQVFLSRDGTPLQMSQVQRMLKYYGTLAGISGVRCSPHTLRHTFAISYLRHGGDAFTLQAILGHASLDIVRIYVNLARADIKTAHRRCSPADNLGYRVQR